MKSILESPPIAFTVNACGDKWFHWLEIHKCFRPGRGRRSTSIDPVLGAIAKLGGVYIMAWCTKPPREASPRAAQVKCIGETDHFKRRMCQFGCSAGFFGERSKGHNPGYRWPKGRHEDLWIAFFQIPSTSFPDYLRRGWRKWMEAIAIHEHVEANRRQPAINAAKVEISFDKQ